MTIKGQSIHEWENWLENELRDDGKECQVFHPDRQHGRAVYRHVVEGFREALKELKRREVHRAR